MICDDFALPMRVALAIYAGVYIIAITVTIVDCNHRHNSRESQVEGAPLGYRIGRDSVAVGIGRNNPVRLRRS